MTDQQTAAVAVTIIVPTFRSGPGLQRVFDSVDEVTLAPGQLEVIFVDDGSGDGTVDRLRAFAADRPHVRVIELENSGWPSRPRNVAIDQARGEYLLFMDHDDSLYPGALRRAYEFGVEQDADVVSPKESKTNDAWWSLRGDGNVPDVREAGGVLRMTPLVPHKLYRRRLVLDHGIRFPEGSRFLWEDWYINLPAYRHGKVAGLEDTALYLWHASATNTSHTFDPSGEDFWDRLDDLFEHISVTLSGPGFERDRAALIDYNLRTRVVQRFARQLSARTRQDPSIADRDAAAEARSLDRARVLLRRYGTPSGFADFPPPQRALARLIRWGRLEQARSLQLAFETIKAHVRVTDLRWREGKLHLTLETSWELTDPDRVSIAADRHGLHLDFSGVLNLMVGRKLRSIGPPLDVGTNIAVRDRVNYLSWLAPGEPVGTPTTSKTGLTCRSRVVIDPATAAAGAPIGDSVWDLRVGSTWWGFESRTGMAYDGPPAPALTGERQGTAYRNKNGNLTIDLSGRLRVPVIDADPEVGAAGPVTGFRAQLARLAMHDARPVDVDLAAIPAEVDLDGLDKGARRQRLAEIAGTAGLSARIAVEDGTAWLTGSAALAEGDYAIFAHRGEAWEPTRYTMSVDGDGIASLATR